MSTQKTKEKATTMEGSCYRSVVSELEGTLLQDHDLFPYFMLLAFEASGLIRFIALLVVWPILRALHLLGMPGLSLRIMIFLAIAGVKESEIEAVARAVLPKFYVDDVDMAAWSVFSSFERRVVVTSSPRLMVQHFVTEHLRADAVIGGELEINRFGYATGFVKRPEGSVSDRVATLFNGERPDSAMGRPARAAQTFINLCKEHLQPPFVIGDGKHGGQLLQPMRIIFHDGRLVRRPTPSTSLLIILWIPLGFILAIIRMLVGMAVPLRCISHISEFFGGEVVVRGRPPPPPSSGAVTGVLFVCTHRTLMDPVVLATVLGRRVTAVTYSISRFSEILSPIPTVRLSRDRQVDAGRIRAELEKGDLVVCPEGTTCREPFLLRFSALFAELTDRIVPVAMNYRVGFFHATTARGWKAMDPIFFFMNPRPVYEVTFLNQLPTEATCAAGKSPHEVANYVQRILAATLGFECTNFTRKDKYRVLAGNDGTTSAFKAATPWMGRVRGLIAGVLPVALKGVLGT